MSKYLLQPTPTPLLFFSPRPAALAHDLPRVRRRDLQQVVRSAQLSLKSVGQWD